ncbi:MAG: DUF2292 domain-containing protein [Clostridia bacterium]|jgi:hypothetical protein|nr:DUF2292 domain-containing protein [Clostridia bacterium]MDH7573492.1 DUF2292 domain-containing protein [Clostridia bacterium]
MGQAEISHGKVMRVEARRPEALVTEDELTEKERKLLDFIRGIEYGEISLIIEDYEPVKMDQIVRKIKL